MKQDGSNVLFQYWNSLRRGRPAPERTEIEPAAIKSVLADTFILERDGDGLASFRLAGTRVCAMYCQELRGLPVSLLWHKQDRPRLETHFRAVFDESAVVAVTFDGLSRTGRFNPFELILLPLASGSGDPRCIGVISAVRKPFWLGADAIVECAIVSIRVVDPDRETALPASRTAVAAPELAPSELPTSVNEALPIGSRRIRHLLVLDGGRTE